MTRQSSYKKIAETDIPVITSLWAKLTNGYYMSAYYLDNCNNGGEWC